jgi:hypothetical protein
MKQSELRRAFRFPEIDRSLGLRPGTTERAIRNGSGPPATEIEGQRVVLAEHLRDWLAAKVTQTSPEAR